MSYLLVVAPLVEWPLYINCHVFRSGKVFGLVFFLSFCYLTNVDVFQLLTQDNTRQNIFYLICQRQTYIITLAIFVAPAKQSAT